jgi:hypothetical protein
MACSNMQQGFMSQQQFTAAGFQCTVHHSAEATLTSMIAAMQQQGANKAAKKQLMWVIQLPTCYVNTYQAATYQAVKLLPLGAGVLQPV